MFIYIFHALNYQNILNSFLCNHKRIRDFMLYNILKFQLSLYRISLVFINAVIYNLIMFSKTSRCVYIHDLSKNLKENQKIS